jgi:hypothetical protein
MASRRRRPRALQPNAMREDSHLPQDVVGCGAEIERQTVKHLAGMSRDHFGGVHCTGGVNQHS